MHSAENHELFLLGFSGLGWVVEAPVIAVHLRWKHRTGLIGIAANGDECFKRVAKQFAETLRMMRSNYFQI